MSGIVGIFNLDGKPVDRDLLSRMTEFMAFRGPDAHQIWIAGSVGFGHAMLRTTSEAQTERQPLTLDGKVWLTADARIDGRDELIESLKKTSESHSLTGQINQKSNDAELVLYAYQAWGEDCVKRLIGDFAFAIWDSRQRRLFCARDHFGLKPFYWARIGDVFIFSNTLNCIREHELISDRLNELAVGDFLLFASNQDSNTTIFQDIKRLPPAHCLSLSSDKQVKSRYWTMPDSPVRYERPAEYVDQFRNLLETAVSDRIRLPKIGISMSGGLDSSSVAAMACRVALKSSAHLEVRAFTMVYDRLIADVERSQAELVANHLGIPINYLTADDYSLYERWDNPNLFYPEPMYFPLSAIAFDHFSRAAEYSPAMLSGDGGDLALLPSGEYLAKQLRSLRFRPVVKSFLSHLLEYHRIPAIGLRTATRIVSGARGQNSIEVPAWFSPRLKRLLKENGRFEPQTEKEKHSNRPEAYAGLMSTAWENIFEQEDPGFTRVRIEKRNPFFDVRLLEFLFSIPSIPWFVHKELIRSAMKGILPDSIRVRAKTPLRGSALSILWRKGWRHHFEPVPELSAFVDIEAFSGLSSDEDIDSRWHDYLPVGLNYWLRNLDATRHNAETETRYELAEQR